LPSGGMSMASFYGYHGNILAYWDKIHF
jgi:hypothetical protein